MQCLTMSCCVCHYHTNAFAAAAQTKPVGFSNDFLVATPGHPFLGQMLTALPAWNRRFGTKYPTVMFSTGPMFVSYQVPPPPAVRCRCDCMQLWSRACILPALLHDLALYPSSAHRSCAHTLRHQRPDVARVTSVQLSWRKFLDGPS